MFYSNVILCYFCDYNIVGTEIPYYCICVMAMLHSDIMYAVTYLFSTPNITKLFKTELKIHVLTIKTNIQTKRKKLFFKYFLIIKLKFKSMIMGNAL